MLLANEPFRSIWTVKSVWDTGHNENIAQCAPVGSYALATRKASYRPKQPVFASVRGSEPDFYHMTQLADGVVFSTSQPDFPNLFVNNDEFQIHGYIIQSDWAYDR